MKIKHILLCFFVGIVTIGVIAHTISSSEFLLNGLLELFVSRVFYVAEGLMMFIYLYSEQYIGSIIFDALDITHAGCDIYTAIRELSNTNFKSFFEKNVKFLFGKKGGFLKSKLATWSKNAFEIANIIFGILSILIIVTRETMKLAWGDNIQKKLDNLII